MRADRAGNQALGLPNGYLVMEKRCDQCLFDADRIVPGPRMAAILRDCGPNDTYFVCHKATLVGADVVCRGFFGQRTCNLHRIAERLGIVRFVPEEALRRVRHGRTLRQQGRARGAARTDAEGAGGAGGDCAAAQRVPEAPPPT